MNAEEAARSIGCSSKTVLRHIAKGTIEATHKHAQELSIAPDQVEKLRKVLASGDKSILSEDMSRQIEALAARCVELEYRVLTLEHRVQLLESRHVPTLPIQEQTSHPSTPSQVSQNRATIANRDLMPVTDFCKLHGIDYQNFFKKALERGLRGDQFDFTEIPHPTRANYKEKFLNPAQQEVAIEMLRRHGKLTG